MEKSKKRYICLILCAVVVVLCTTPALAVVDTHSISAFRQIWVDGTNVGASYTFTGDETVVEFSGGFLQSQGDDNTPLSIQPYTSYTGVINISTTTTIPEVWNIKDHFRLIGKNANNAPDWSVVTPLTSVVLTKEIDQSYTENSATNMINYTLRFAFRIDATVNTDTYYFIGFRVPITPNKYDAGDTFRIRNITVTDTSYDFSGDAFKDYVANMLDVIWDAMAEDTRLTQEAIDDAMGSIVSAVNSGTMSTLEAMARMQQLQQSLLDQGYSLEMAIDTLGIDINNGFIGAIQGLQNWTAEHDAQIQADEDSITQQRANAGQEEAADVFNSTKFTTGLTSLLTGLNYSGTSFNFRFPAAHDVPYLGDLWDSKPIPFKEWIDNIPNPILVAARVVFWLGVILSVFWHFQNLLDIIGGVDKQ